MFDQVYIIAEIGINHNGDYDLAEKMVIEAAKSGVNAVKFQNFRTEDFIFDQSLSLTYQSQGKKITESMWDLFKRTEMKEGWIPKLKSLCDRLKVDFLSTPTNVAGIHELVNAGVKMLKNGSDYLTHVALLEEMGKTGLPVIVSTGMAHESEIKDAIEAIHKGGGSQIILLHCTSVYPTPTGEANLRRMVSLRQTFKTLVGFSDHTIGFLSAVQAVALGACVIEKHFTLDHHLPGPDHWFSLDPKELKEFIVNIRNAEQNMGHPVIEPAKLEKNSCQDYKLSIRVKHDMKAGDIIKFDDLTVARPGHGLPPKEMSNLVSRRLSRNILKGAALTLDDIN